MDGTKTEEVPLGVSARATVFTGEELAGITEQPSNKRQLYALIQFNHRLSAISGTPLNESDLVRLMHDWQALSDQTSDLNLLSLARIMELALFCAGNYADGCEFEAVGDLLVNPRLVDIYFREGGHPTAKIRHGAISEQLSGLIADSNPVDWLKRHTWTSVRKQALLPALYEALSNGDHLSQDYLKSIEQRMCRVADTTAFLSAWQICDAADLRKKMESAPRNLCLFIADNLCRFDLALFHELGHIITGTGTNETHCRFLGGNGGVHERHFFHNSLCQ
jgi:hypothetical protein